MKRSTASIGWWSGISAADHQGTLSGHYDYLSLAIQFSIN